MTRTMTGLLLVAILAVAGCRNMPVYNPQNVSFAPSAASSSKQLRLKDFKNAIIRAGAKRGWAFTQKAPGHLIGKVTVRGKHYAEVDVLFDQEAFTINYRNSRDLKYMPENNTIHKNYNTWINNLQKDIQSEITILKAS
ncbi:MAG: hypothetical protein AB8B85_17565 [Paracoccaceae bacterium]